MKGAEEKLIVRVGVANREREKVRRGKGRRWRDSTLCVSEACFCPEKGHEVLESGVELWKCGSHRLSALMPDMKRKNFEPIRGGGWGWGCGCGCGVITKLSPPPQSAGVDAPELRR